MAFCGNCGNEIPDGMKFCSNCGNKIAQSEQAKGFSTENADEVNTKHDADNAIYVRKPGINRQSTRIMNIDGSGQLKGKEENSKKWLWAGIGISALIVSIIGIINHSTWISMFLSVAALVAGIVCIVKSNKLRGFAIAAIVVAVLNFMSYAYGYDLEVKDREEAEKERDMLKQELQDLNSSQTSAGNRKGTDYVDVPKGTLGGSESGSNKKADDSQSNNSDSKDNILINGGVDPDLKAFLDSYEKYMDEYIDFMQKYMTNPTDLSLLAKYADMMTKYADFAEKIDKYDSDDMSTEDAAYYLEVTTRVTQKMLNVLGTTSL